jgi:hypothetical protein
LMRYFEWFFPIHKYVRLRREMPGWLAWASLMTAVLVVPGAIIMYDFVDWSVGYSIGFSLRPGPGPSFSSAIGPYLAGRLDLVVFVLVFTTFAFTLLSGLTLLISLSFVRKQPGRRRPICTWQTFKYSMRGSQTWLLLAGLWFVSVYVLVHSDWLEHVAEKYSLLIGTIVFTSIILSIFLVAGATSVQAAQAVITLQDDRRCKECGYFLIGLTTPRCPECGTPFDPAKLVQLAQTREAPQPGRP